MFGHGLFQTRASMAAQIKTQAELIGKQKRELDELAAQVRKLTPHRGKGGRFEAKTAEWEGAPHEYGYAWGPLDGPGDTDKFIPSTATGWEAAHV